nr:chymotrypsin inhibitor-like isoform X3 [Aedes albopictus]
MKTTHLLVIVVCLAAVLISSGWAQAPPDKVPAAPKECGENEIYLECGSECPPTCINWRLRRRTTYCASTCVPGCFCKVRFVRDNTDGSCILPRDCRRRLRTRGPEE